MWSLNKRVLTLLQLGAGVVSIVPATTALRTPVLAQEPNFKPAPSYRDMVGRKTKGKRREY